MCMCMYVCVSVFLIGRHTVDSHGISTFELDMKPRFWGYWQASVSLVLWLFSGLCEQTFNIQSTPKLPGILYIQLIVIEWATYPQQKTLNFRGCNTGKLSMANGPTNECRTQCLEHTSSEATAQGSTERWEGNGRAGPMNYDATSVKPPSSPGNKVNQLGSIWLKKIRVYACVRVCVCARMVCLGVLRCA